MPVAKLLLGFWIDKTIPKRIIMNDEQAKPVLKNLLTAHRLYANPLFFSFSIKPTNSQ